MNLKFLFIFVCVLISFVLFGCKQDGIKFYRESGVQRMVNEVKDTVGKYDSTTVKSKSGVYIHKDNSVNDTTGGQAVFGPKDIEFGVPEE